MLLIANFTIQNDAKKLKNDWNPGMWVLIWEYSVRDIQWILTWQGLDGFQKALRSCALDESSHSIERVKTGFWDHLYCFHKLYILPGLTFPWTPWLFVEDLQRDDDYSHIHLVVWSIVPELWIGPHYICFFLHWLLWKTKKKQSACACLTPLYLFLPVVITLQTMNIWLTLPMLRLLSFNAQEHKDFWKTSKPCHVSTHWIALT